jgi:hypothetical protein
MDIVNRESLALTLDALNDALVSSVELADADRQEAAAWIAGRQGLPRSYRGMPAPTDADFANRVKLFTGEAVTSRAGTAHILGEESCRALMLLRPLDAGAEAALERSQAWLREPEMQDRGHYCCGVCSVSMWRHLVTWPDAEARISDGMRLLRESRVDGGWRPYPFWYTVLALTEIGTPAAVEELRFVETRLSKRALGGPTSCAYARRRLAIAERALALV